MLGVVVVCALAAAPGASGDEYSDYAAVRRDWQPDRVITACRFTVSQLENARSLLTGEDNYSGMQGAIEAEISRQRTGGCPGGGGPQGAPVVSRARFVPSAFRAAKGSTLRFGLSRAANVSVLVQRRLGARWTRAASFTRTRRRTGENSLPFSARGLAPGAYRAVLVATAGRARSRPARAAFTVRR
ncbi:MAG: hypothetical protein QOE65_3092 [Solirubrobacteraceae bacterium]|jgi:hypothetical protein|nr:hypothetical protein [Solirubrobacteraceae bacterium]